MLGVPIDAVDKFALCSSSTSECPSVAVVSTATTGFSMIDLDGDALTILCIHTCIRICACVKVCIELLTGISGEISILFLFSISCSLFEHLFFHLSLADHSSCLFNLTETTELPDDCLVCPKNAVPIAGVSVRLDVVDGGRRDDLEDVIDLDIVDGGRRDGLEDMMDIGHPIVTS